MHSEKFDEVRDFYLNGLWKKKRLENAVKMNWITQEEYDEIIALKEEMNN